MDLRNWKENSEYLSVSDEERSLKVLDCAKQRPFWMSSEGSE